MLPLLSQLLARLRRQEKHQLLHLNRLRLQEKLPPFATWSDYQLLTQIKLYKDKKKRRSHYES